MMKISTLPTLAVAACLAATQIASLNAAVSFRGTAGSYAASVDHLGAGAQTLSAWTLELWINPTTVAVRQGLLDIHGAWNESSITIGDGGTIGILNIVPYTYYSTSSGLGVITENEWQHLAFVSDGQTMAIFRNGIVVAIGVAPPYIFIAGEIAGDVAGTFNFGFSDYQTVPDGSYYSGSLADFRVWDRALTTTELALHVRKQPKSKDDGLLNWIPFDETEDTTFFDALSVVSGSYFNVDFVPGPLPAFKYGHYRD